MSNVQDVYDGALESLVAKAQADPCALAAILLGSLAYDTVWQRSDIDLLVVVEETPRKREWISLVEAGVNIHCMVATRSEFRRMLEGAVQGSFMHSMLLKGRLLFSKDEPLTELFEARGDLGERDRTMQLLRTASWLLPCLAKAEKWLHVKRDPTYCCHWLLKCADPLASIVVLLSGQVPTREVIHQALPLEPDLLRAVYTDPIELPLSAERLDAAISAIQLYLRSNAPVLFAPLLSYLEEEGALRSMTDINHHFSRHLGIDAVDAICEWLADEGLLNKLATPVRLTNRSAVAMEEAAYSYPGGDVR